MKKGKGSPHMNPDTTPPANTEATSSAGNKSWSQRLSNLNTPQKLLLAAAVVMAALVLTLAIYQVTREEAPKSPTPTAAIPQAAVSISKDGFIPASITIRAGTQLTWTNQDSKPHQVAADPHPLNNSIEGFDSATTLLKGDSSAFIFERSGTYSLHDHLNPLNSKYRLQVVVE